MEMYVRKMDTHKDSCVCVVLDFWLVAWSSELPIKSIAILFVAWMCVCICRSSVLYYRNIYIAHL